MFDAWTSEEVLRCWWHAGRDWETTTAEVDLRVGGVARVVMRDPHRDVDHGGGGPVGRTRRRATPRRLPTGGGTYTEIDPPTRLALTWIWDGETRRTLIELDLDEADGVTTVRFTHSSLLDDATMRSHEDGWGKAFDNLERTLEAAGREG